MLRQRIAPLFLLLSILAADVCVSCDARARRAPSPPAPAAPTGASGKSDPAARDEGDAHSAEAPSDDAGWPTPPAPAPKMEMPAAPGAMAAAAPSMV